MMRRLALRLNPVTRRRLRRFRQLRRGWYSLLLLAGLYTLSLFSEFLANDQPLYVRYEGRHCFPVLFYYPEADFLPGGEQTRPDYKALNRGPGFADNPDNFMLFPPIPYGPYENIEASEIDLPEEVTLRLRREPRRATLNVLPDLRIERSRGAAAFFGLDDEPRDETLDSYYEVPDPLRQAVAQRFENRAAEPLDIRLEPRAPGLQPVLAGLSTYRQRGRPPRSVRIGLEEIVTELGAAETLVFGPGGQLLRGGGGDAWEAADPDEREAVLQRVERRFEEPVHAETLALGGARYRMSFEKRDVRFPFPPLRGHWLGIDHAGRDVLARILYGLRISMSFALLLVLFSMALGIAIGAVQGYFGGLVDITGQRLIEIWSALPFLYIMILMGSIFGRSFALLLAVYAIFNWIGISYYIRAEFLRLRRQQFVEAARCIGVPTWKILFLHIFPNALVPVVTFFPFYLVGAISALAALDYLGFGMPPPTASWGELLNQAQQYRWAWWLIAFPSAALFIVILLGVFIGEAARNAFDPRDHSGLG